MTYWVGAVPGGFLIDDSSLLCILVAETLIHMKTNPKGKLIAGRTRYVVC